MNFVEAVNSSLIKNYATFKGRACRAEWWYFLLFSVIASILAILIVLIANFSILPAFLEQYTGYVEADDKNSTNFAARYMIESDLGKQLIMAELVVSLALFLPAFAVTVRRVQDLDASYYWALPYLITMLINLWYSIFPQETLAELAARLGGLIFLVTIVYLLAFVRRGSFDNNRFGPDPLDLEEDTY